MDERSLRSQYPCSMRLVCLWTLLPTLVLFLIASSVGNAQVVTNITSSGLNTTVTQVGNSYNITGGTRPGSGPNLFHSFGDFSVGAGDIGNFLNTPVNGSLPLTSNILGRVTGGSTSNIYGTIQTTDFGNANLFLVNPSGIVFGPNGSVSVGGSVSFTTAQYFRLFDGVNSANFYANPASDGLANSVLAVAPVVDFGFLSPAAYGFLTPPDPSATIMVQGSILSIPPALPDAPPNTISLVGGKVVIEGGAQLSAPNGRIHLATAMSPGEFAALPGESLANATSLQAVPNNPVDPSSAAAFTSYGLMSLAPGSSIDVSGARTVFLIGGQLVFSVNDATLNTSESTAPQDTISLSPGSSIVTSNFGTEPGADVQITVGTLNLDGSSIRTETFGEGNGGNITADVGTLSLANFAELSSSNSSFGPGQGGTVTVEGLEGRGSAADSVMLDTLAVIKTETFGPGRGGDLSITAREMQMNNQAEVRTGTFFGGGVGGDLTLNVETLILNAGSTVKTTDFTFATDLDFDGVPDVPSTGAGGHVTIHGIPGAGSAAESLALSGGSRIVSESLDGNGGQLSIAAISVNLDGASSIDSGTFGFGRGGDIVLSVENASLSGGSIIASRPVFFNPVAGEPGNITVQGLNGNGSKADILTLTDFPTGILQDTYGTASAGDIAVHAKTVSLTNGAVIEGGTTEGEGTGGKVAIDANSVSIAGGSHISSQARAQDAGEVTITANQLTLNNGSIVTTTKSDIGGRGGNVVLDVGAMSLTNGASINSQSEPLSTGRAGDITITAGQSATLTNGSSISASSSGTGNAGNITIQSGSTVVLNNSSITTEAREASGGQIEINAPEMVRLTNSQISTSVAGSETDTAGGDITIDPQFVVLQNSQVIAQAFAGSGGAIDITAGVFQADPASIVDASSTLGISGTVNIQSPLQNVGGRLTPLSQQFSSAAALLAQRCAARVADGKFSTFVVAGREGLPVELGGFLASPSWTAELLGASRSGLYPHTPIAAVAGSFPEYDARSIQLAKFVDACR